MDRKVYYYNYVDDAIMAMCKKINYLRHASMISGKGKLYGRRRHKAQKNDEQFSQILFPLLPIGFFVSFSRLSIRTDVVKRLSLTHTHTHTHTLTHTHTHTHTLTHSHTHTHTHTLSLSPLLSQMYTLIMWFGSQGTNYFSAFSTDNA